MLLWTRLGSAVGSRDVTYGFRVLGPTAAGRTHPIPSSQHTLLTLCRSRSRLRLSPDITIQFTLNPMIDPAA